MLSKKVNFIKATPVWAVGKNTEMNYSVCFAADFDCYGPKNYVLRITGASVYNIFVNGVLAHVGPARCGHGYFRVDELSLDSFLRFGSNEIRILTAGYNTNSYYLLDQPSFLCAEIVSDGKVRLYTSASGKDGFTARHMNERVQRVQKFSFQRTFAESYDYVNASSEPVELENVPAGEFIERGVPFQDFSRVDVKCLAASGSAVKTELPDAARFRPNYVAEVRPERIKGFKEDELCECTMWTAQGFRYTPEETCEKTLQKGNMDVCGEGDGYRVFDVGFELTGMPCIDIDCSAETEIYLLFDEIIRNNDPHNVDFLRLGCSNVIKWKLPAGHSRVMAFEPNSMRYMKLVIFGEKWRINDICMFRHTFRNVRYRKFDDDRMQRIYDSAVETFRQNATDIYMDCPSRERAGWLCDSYFTSKSERYFTGESVIERNFLENFLLPDSFKCLPEGMLPMCYPSDHYDGVFIPNWAMWYVVELGEYFERTGDRELVDKAKDKVYKLIKYFTGLENEFGLLEKLESWVFLEWSKSNELVQDVNFPSNFLYAFMIQTAAELYGDAELKKKGDSVLKTASEMSFTGKFFCDNAVRKDGKLILSGECTESCQYYAFFTGAATPETHPELFRILVDDFGPERKQTGKWPEIYFANAFIGNYLRLVWLDNLGYKDKVKENILGYFLYMADKTGTLWENDGDYASCNHGFASYVAAMM